MRRHSSSMCCHRQTDLDLVYCLQSHYLEVPKTRVLPFTGLLCCAVTTTPGGGRDDTLTISGDTNIRSHTHVSSKERNNSTRPIWNVKIGCVGLKTLSPPQLNCTRTHTHLSRQPFSPPTSKNKRQAEARKPTTAQVQREARKIGTRRDRTRR